MIGPRPLPESWEGHRVTIGGENDTTPAEYAVRPPPVIGGTVDLTVRLAIDDDSRQILADGGDLWLTLYGGELPWRLEATAPDSEVPAQ